LKISFLLKVSGARALHYVDQAILCNHDLAIIELKHPWIQQGLGAIIFLQQHHATCAFIFLELWGVLLHHLS